MKYISIRILIVLVPVPSPALPAIKEKLSIGGRFVLNMVVFPAIHLN